jgi:hypothetical protein
MDLRKNILHEILHSTTNHILFIKYHLRYAFHCRKEHVWLAAIAEDDVRIIMRMPFHIENFDKLYGAAIISEARLNNSKCLKFFMAKAFPCSISMVKRAAQYGNMNVIKYICDSNNTFEGINIIKNIIRYGCSDLLEEFIELYEIYIEFEYSDPVFYAAAKYNRLDCAKILMKHFDYSCNKFMFNRIVKHRNLEFLKFTIDNLRESDLKFIISYIYEITLIYCPDNKEMIDYLASKK